MSTLEGHEPSAAIPTREPGPLAFVGALSEMMPVPFIVYDKDGRIVLLNRPVEHLLVAAPGGLERRLLTFDGMDLWDLIVSRLGSAGSFMSLATRLRTTTSRSAEISFMIAPILGGDSQLGGAIVFAYDAPDEREAAALHPHPLDISAGSEDAPFAPILRLLVEQLGADAGVLLEVEPDRPLHGRMIAAVQDGLMLDGFEWSAAGTPAVSLAGRRTIVQASGVREAFPDDLWAATESFDSFIGTYLFDEDGGRVGLLGAYSRDPIEAPAVARGIVRLFASRISPSLRHLRADRELRESEERYSALFEDSHLPILLIEAESTQILEANDAACRFYGYEHDDLTTMSIMQINTLAPEDVQQELARAMNRTRDYFQFHHRLADGTVRDVEVYSGPIAVHGRKVLYSIIHDVTERHRAEAEIQRYKKELEQLLLRRTNDLMRTSEELQQTATASELFYRNVGHELRTPLHTIIGFSDLLAQGMAGALNEEQSRQIGMILDAGRALDALVDDVLELSRIDTGVEHCEPEQFDLNDLAASVVMGVEPLANERGLAINIATAEQGTLQAFTDRHKVEQIMLQLLSNAIKYTDEGSVTLEVERHAADMCVLRVSDTGTGIEPVELPHIFEEFRQVARQDSGTHEGTGLGLAVCRRLTEIIGGSISVQSAPGRGSAFEVTFPLHCE